MSINNIQRKNKNTKSQSINQPHRSIITLSNPYQHRTNTVPTPTMVGDDRSMITLW